MTNEAGVTEMGWAPITTYIRMAFPHIYRWNSGHGGWKKLWTSDSVRNVPFSEFLGARVLHSALEMACEQGGTLHEARFVSQTWNIQITYSASRYV